MSLDNVLAVAAAAKGSTRAARLMGTRGHGGLVGMLLADVARKVIHLTVIPVLLVK